jgi:hypothetical protein
VKIYAHECAAQSGTIFLDGRPVSHALFADDDAGIVVRYKRGRDGKLVVLPDRSFREGYLERETLYGDVEIVFNVLSVAGPNSRQ